MKAPFTVYQNDNPLTLPIMDGKRAALAYNVFCALSEECVTVYGKEIDKAALAVRDAEGKSFKPEPDLEWYGDPDDIIAYRNAVAKVKGQSVKKQLAVYSVVPDGMDIVSDSFGILTWDFDKAVEVVNFIRYGIDRAAELSYWHTAFERRNFDPVPITMESGNILDGNDEPVKRIPDIPDWTTGQILPGVAG